MSAKYSELAVSSFPGHFLSYFKWTFIQQTGPDLAHVEEIKFTTRSSPGALRPRTTSSSRDRGPQASFQALPPPRLPSLLGAPTCPCSCRDDVTSVDGVGVGQPGGGGEHSRPCLAPELGPPYPALRLGRHHPCSWFSGLCAQTKTRWPASLCLSCGHQEVRILSLHKER